MKKFFEKFWPLVFIFGVWFIFSSPYFFGNKVPYPSKYQVTFFTPWNQYQEFAGPVKNGAMPDVVDQIYPWKHFTIESLKKGQIPLWNPYSFSGNPHLANYQSAVFSPFNLLFFVLPFIDAWSFLILLQPLLAGIFIYLLIRELKVSQAGSLLSAISFMFCGFMVVWMAYGTLSMAMAFLPLALLGIEKGFGKKRLFSFLLPLSLAISFFSGHFQISLYFALYAFGYLVFKYFATRDARAFLHTAILYVVGILISLVQIIPSMELYKLAARSEILNNGGAIPYTYLTTLFAPDFYGNPVTRNDWVGSYAEWGSFIGIVPFVLSLIAIFVQVNKIRLFFFIAGVVALLLALDTPLQQALIASRIPIFSTSIPSRMIILFSFSFVVLAGFGFDLLLENVKKRSWKKVLVPVLAAGILMIVILASSFLLLPKDKAILAARNMVLPCLFFSLIVACIAFGFTIKKKASLLILICVLISMTAFDSLRFAGKWMPFDERRFVFPKLPVIEVMQKNIGLGRVYGEFGAFIDTYYDLPSIDGYDPLYSKRYGEFIQSATSGEFVSAQRSVVGLDKRGKYADRVLDLLGANLLYHPYSNTDKSWAYPVWDKLDKYDQIYRDDKFQVFKNKTALTRAKMFYSYEILKDDRKIIKRFYDDKFDFRNALILEEDPGLTNNSEQKTNNTVEVTSYTPNEVVISISTTKPGLIFLSDNYYPTWRAKVNGKEAKIYRADYSFRAVVVREGKSVVEFSLERLF